MPSITGPTWETDHLVWDEFTGRVELKCIDDRVSLGPIDSADDDCPSLLHGELEQLREMVQESYRYGRAIEATERHADRERFSPEAWR